MARRTMDALATSYLRPVRGLPAEIGVLGSGRYNKLTGLATANELVWGDYYFTEALTVLDGDLDPLTV
jgi:unsaturated chondroitin disaccharide hydrolase